VERRCRSARRAEKTHPVGAGRIERDQADVRPGLGMRPQADESQKERRNLEPGIRTLECATGRRYHAGARSGCGIPVTKSKFQIPNSKFPIPDFQNSTLMAHCIALGPPCAMTGLPASTSGVEFTIANEPLRVLVLGKLPR